MQPVVLDANQPRDRFYRGGSLIAGFRGSGADGDHVPEDWVASTTALAGHERVGLSILPDGRTLRDAVMAEPEKWLSPEHIAAFGADTRLLVKLLDAGERLPVHAHPGREFASRWLARAHGKAEAWHILIGGDIYLGLRAPVDLARLQALVAAQDTTALLALLNRRTVSRGDTVFVPTGQLHAIGEGILLAELQEPEDLSILLEWQGFQLNGLSDGHLGLGFDVALQAVDRTPLAPKQLDDLITSNAWGLEALPAAAVDYFRLERHRVETEVSLAPGFAVVIVVEGTVDAGTGPLPAGSTIVVPWAAGDLKLTGSGEVLVCRPPLP